MKKIFCLFQTFLLVLLFTRCSSNKQEQRQEEVVAFQTESAEIPGEQRMQTSKNEQTVQLKGKDYHISIVREANAELPKVKTESGTTFLDNKITLNISYEKGEIFFNKTFTKQSFSSLITSNFLSNSILEGLVFDKISSDGLHFAASVSYPQTDLYIPISVKISPNGKLSMKKEEAIEELYTGDEEL